MKILVIIPAFNEEKSVADVIKNVLISVPQADILVVNDGSTDNTSAVASASGAAIINLPFNLGIGGAMQTGFIYASRNGYQLAIQIDADGQHDPSYAAHLINPIIDGSADMVIGSRYISETKYKSSIGRKTGIVFFSILVSLLVGKKITDTTSGFRAVNKKVIDYFADYYPADYPEVDVLVKLHKRNFKIIEVPVEMKIRQSGKSSITPLRSMYYMVKVSLSILIGAIRADSK